VERTCVGCLQVASKDQLIRLVCSPSGQVLLDIYGKLPGRGAYLCARRRCAEQALQKTRLQEALRRKVSVAGIDELVGAMVGVMMERARSCIRIARKAGRVVSGYTQVGRALTYEPVACLLVAEDTAPDRLREYEGWCAKRRIPCHLFLTKTQLGELAGRDESSALAILEPRLGERLIGYLEGMGRLTER
jgi:predicted RNA-binding protein YlxR (DUF448 family)